MEDPLKLELGDRGYIVSVIGKRKCGKSVLIRYLLSFFPAVATTVVANYVETYKAFSPSIRTETTFSMEMILALLEEAKTSTRPTVLVLDDCLAWSMMDMLTPFWDQFRRHCITVFVVQQTVYPFNFDSDVLMIFPQLIPSDRPKLYYQNRLDRFFPRLDVFQKKLDDCAHLHSYGCWVIHCVENPHGEKMIGDWPDLRVRLG